MAQLNRNSQPKVLASPFMEDDDDFQYCPPLSSRLPPPNKKLKAQILKSEKDHSIAYCEELSCGLDSIQPSLELLNQCAVITDNTPDINSVERNLMEEENVSDEEGGNTQIDMLLKLCDEAVSIQCPVCGADFSDLTDDARQVHTNGCLDGFHGSDELGARDRDSGAYECPGQVVDGSPLKYKKKDDVDMSPVIEWLRLLGLSKYEEVFVSNEIDWEALHWLTEEDLCSIGITALGSRKKILHALSDIRNGTTRVEKTTSSVSKGSADEKRQGTYRKITDFFSGPPSERRRVVLNNIQNNVSRSQTTPTPKNTVKKSRAGNAKQKDVPLWCCIPGTPFRVDAFKYLRRDCSHWFLTHFHLDHYQGLTRSFSHGKIYCSSITAKLVNLKIGIPFDDIQVLPLNQKINIAGTDVTCFDANHCPGAIIILFEPPNGKSVLHTGDFRFSEGMAQLSVLQSCTIDTLILDTTYCNPKYDFPKQEAVIQFVIDAIQAEAFNPKTLFLIGSYTIGKERLFMDVGRALHKKVYVTTAKLRLLECIGLQPEDTQWLTTNEEESHIHVVPMWSIASFKRLKHMANQYMDRFSLIVAFSPSGLTFGKGKKSTGRRWQQGTIIRYEVPYSEHSSFTELKEFVKLVSPVNNIIPSVNNHDQDSHSSMVSLLLDNSFDHPTI